LGLSQRLDYADRLQLNLDFVVVAVVLKPCLSSD